MYIYYVCIYVHIHVYTYMYVVLASLLPHSTSLTPPHGTFFIFHSYRRQEGHKLCR